MARFPENKKVTIGYLKKWLEIYPDSYEITVLDSYKIKGFEVVEQNNKIKLLVKLLK